MAGGGERPIQPQDYDALDAGATSDTGGDEFPEREQGGIFDFPRGAASGTCLHEIFERLDYARLEPETIARTAADACGPTATTKAGFRQSAPWCRM